MQVLQHAQSATQADTTLAGQLASSSRPSAPDSTVLPEASTEYSTNAEMGEIDTSEDAIDGMGAIKFTDEEDCGYFGTISQFVSSSWPGSSLTLKVHHLTLPLYAISH